MRRLSAELLENIAECAENGHTIAIACDPKDIREVYMLVKDAAQRIEDAGVCTYSTVVKFRNGGLVLVHVLDGPWSGIMAKKVYVDRTNTFISPDLERVNDSKATQYIDLFAEEA